MRIYANAFCLFVGLFGGKYYSNYSLAVALQN